MMNTKIISSIIFNIGLLVVIAQIIARIGIIKRVLLRNKVPLNEKIIMMVMFGGIGIISTSIGHGVNGALANTRVIGVMAGGFIGGPIVGIGASIIAGLHRYFIDINGFTAVACAISTILEGLISAYFSKYLKNNKYKEVDLFIITFAAEILQMIIILIFAKPYKSALELVIQIAFPMVIINSIGMVLFISVFKHIFIEQEYELGKKINLAFDITKKCLPVLSTGQYDKDNCRKIGKIILEFSNELGILFTDTNQVIYSKGKLSLIGSYLPDLAKKIIKERKVCFEEEAAEYDVLHKAMDKMVAIGAPLTKNGEVFGTFIIFTSKYKLTLHSEVQFVEGLSELLSVQYELAEMEKQKELLQKAEFQALQSQINPHFIFNSLNTISAFCREKPEKARELLIDLATYFRNSIQNKEGLVSIYDEMDYVNAYLQLEKARFDERLNITVDIPDNLDLLIPCLILQPIVENGIKHGAMKRKQGELIIKVKKEKKYVQISVIDNGFGMPESIIKSLNENNPNSNSIGLYNVNRRLCYMYGKANGLDIKTSSEGTTVNINIPL